MSKLPEETLWKAYCYLNRSFAPNYSATNLQALNILLDALRAVKTSVRKGN